MQYLREFSRLEPVALVIHKINAKQKTSYRIAKGLAWTGPVLPTPSGVLWIQPPLLVKVV